MLKVAMRLLPLFLVGYAVVYFWTTQLETDEIIQIMPLTVVLFASKANPHFCANIRSALTNNLSVHVIGWNAHKHNVVINNVISRESARHVCSLFKSGDVVLGSDAYDAFFLKGASPGAILRAFHRTNESFLWSAEVNLFPDFKVLPSWAKRAYPNISNATPYKFLNYGGWIGDASAVCDVLTAVSSVMKKCGKYCEGATDNGLRSHHDQHAAQLVYAAQHNEKLHAPPQGLDFDNHFFHAAWPKCESILKSADGTLKVNETGRAPFMLHLNGDAKFLCPDMYSDAWFASKNSSSNHHAEAPMSTTVRLSQYGGHQTSSIVDAESICDGIWSDHLLKSVREMRSEIIRNRYSSG